MLEWQEFEPLCKSASVLLRFPIFSVLISGMAVSNEQAHTAAMESSNVIQCACADVSAWLVAAARELHHSLAPPVDLLLHAFKEDLKSKLRI